MSDTPHTVVDARGRFRCGDCRKAAALFAEALSSVVDEALAVEVRALREAAVAAATRSDHIVGYRRWLSGRTYDELCGQVLGIGERLQAIRPAAEPRAKRQRTGDTLREGALRSFRAACEAVADEVSR